jgi:hypothetical protein
LSKQKNSEDIGLLLLLCDAVAAFAGDVGERRRRKSSGRRRVALAQMKRKSVQN